GSAVVARTQRRPAQTLLIRSTSAGRDSRHTQDAASSCADSTLAVRLDDIEYGESNEQEARLELAEDAPDGHLPVRGADITASAILRTCCERCSKSAVTRLRGAERAQDGEAGSRTLLIRSASLARRRRGTRKFLRVFRPF